LEEYPEAAKEENSLGALTIQVALQYQAFLNSIKMIF
jgi:hypothetical protein